MGGRSLAETARLSGVAGGPHVVWGPYYECDNGGSWMTFSVRFDFFGTMVRSLVSTVGTYKRSDESAGSGRFWRYREYLPILVPPPQLAMVGDHQRARCSQGTPSFFEIGFLVKSPSAPVFHDLTSLDLLLFSSWVTKTLAEVLSVDCWQSDHLKHIFSVSVFGGF